jgi:hypothetical protein
MTKINLDTHEFGNQITPEHPFVQPTETVAKDVNWNPPPELPIIGRIVWPEEDAETSTLLNDLVEQLQFAREDAKILLDSRNSWRELAITYSAELTEYEMSYWAKFKRWVKQQWSYDIYEENFPG